MKHMYKTVLFTVLLLMVCVPVMAQEAYVDEPYTIHAYVLLNGQYVNMSSANITIFLPNGSALITNDVMNETTISGHQVFEYIYTPNTTGQYTHVATFINDSSPYAFGFETITVVTGDELTRLTYGVCARSGAAMALLIGAVFIGLVLILLSVFGVHYAVGLFGSLMLFAASLYLFPCAALFGWIILFLSLFAGIALLFKT